MRKNKLPTSFVSEADGSIDVDRVVDVFCRVLENRAPQLGAAFRGFLCSHSELQFVLTQYISVEFNYLNRESTMFERETVNADFRLALAESGGESFYLAVRSCVHSMASAMVRDALAADVKTATGGSANAN